METTFPSSNPKQVAAGTAREWDAPVPPSMEEAANTANIYCTGYTCKPDNLVVNDALVARAAQRSAGAADDLLGVPAMREVGWQGRHNVRQLLNQVHGAVTMPAALCAYLVLNNRDCTATWNTAPLSH